MTRAYERHGLRNHPLYVTGSMMHDRCCNRRSSKWPHYGGRGLTVCERWASFSAFAADMGARPAGTTLDRQDNSLGYSPDNCRWATKREQNLNRRTGGKTGVNGVAWAAREGKWRVRAWAKEGEKHLGYFGDFFEACCTRKSAELRFTQTA